MCGCCLDLCRPGKLISLSASTVQAGIRFLACKHPSLHGHARRHHVPNTTKSFATESIERKLLKGCCRKKSVSVRSRDSMVGPGFRVRDGACTVNAFAGVPACKCAEDVAKWMLYMMDDMGLMSARSLPSSRFCFKTLFFFCGCLHSHAYDCDLRTVDPDQ